jgi:hypothetical protein
MNRVPEPPPAQGMRVEWPAIPAQVRLAFEHWAGSRAVAAISQPSGFSPGVAARLRLADGRRMFVKAVGPSPKADSPVDEPILWITLLACVAKRLRTGALTQLWWGGLRSNLGAADRGIYRRCRECTNQRARERYYRSPEVLESERARSRRDMRALRLRRRLQAAAPVDG